MCQAMRSLAIRRHPLDAQWPGEEHTLVMRLYGYSDLLGRATYLSEGALLSYWTGFSWVPS